MYRKQLQLTSSSNTNWRCRMTAERMWTIGSRQLDINRNKVSTTEQKTWTKIAWQKCVFRNRKAKLTKYLGFRANFNSGNYDLSKIFYLQLNFFIGNLGFWHGLRNGNRIGHMDSTGANANLTKISKYTAGILYLEFKWRSV